MTDITFCCNHLHSVGTSWGYWIQIIIYN